MKNLRNNICLFNIERKKVLNIRRIVMITVIIITVVLAFGLFLKYVSPDSQAFGDIPEEEQMLYDQYNNAKDWKEQYEIQMKLNKMLMVVYSEEYIDMQNSLLQYKIDNNLAPSTTNKNNTFDFTEYVYSTLGFIFVLIAVLLFSDFYYVEIKNNTEKAVYSKPFKRSTIFFNKYAIAVISIIAIMLFSLLISITIGGLFFSFFDGNEKDVFYFNHSIMCQTKIVKALIHFLLVTLNTVFLGSISFALTSIFRSQLIGVVTTVAAYFFGNVLMENVFENNTLLRKYLFLSYTNLEIFIDNPIPDYLKLSTALILMFIFSLSVVFISSFVIKKRDVK